MTGGRIKRIQPYIGNEPFMLAYGDGGIAMLDVAKLVEFHQQHGKLCYLDRRYPETAGGAFWILKSLVRSEASGEAGQRWSCNQCRLYGASAGGV